MRSCLVLLLCALLGGAACAAPGKTPDSVAFYRQKVAADPHHAVAWALLSDALLTRYQEQGRSRDLAEAEAAGRRSLREAVTFNGLHAAARLAGYRHRFQESLRWADAALDALPHHGPTASLAVTALMELGRYTEAEERIEKALRERDDAFAWMDAARLRWLQGDARGSREALARARRWALARPDGAPLAAWCDTEEARQWLTLGEFGRAEARFRNALARRRGDLAARIGLADLALAAGRIPEAVRRYRALLREREDPDLRADLARCYRALGRRAAAEREFDRAERAWKAERRRGEVSSLRHLALLYLEWGRRPREALALARADAALRGGIYTDATLARALAANSHLDEAWEAARRSVRLGTPDPSLLGEAARIALASGCRQEAAELRKRAAALAHGAL